LDADGTKPDLDIGPAAAKLRFFRFAEFIVIFFAIVSVSLYVAFSGADNEPGLASSFPEGVLTLVLVGLAAVIIAGFLTYLGAGKLRAGPLNRQRFLMPITTIALLVLGVVIFMQAQRLMHRAQMARFSPPTAAIELSMLKFDPLFQIQPRDVQERKIAELQERAARERVARLDRSVRYERAAGPLIGISEFHLLGGIAAALGVWGLFVFMRTPVRPSTTPMSYLDAVEVERGKQTPPRQRGEPIDRTRGLIFLGLGIVLLVVLVAYPDFGFVINVLLAVLLGVGIFVCLIRARQYFQTSADSLLEHDKRAPILFLRSFSDDPKINAAAGVTYEGVARLVDFSLETRLTNHFMQFGPFIAVGLPSEAVPQIGAARAKLSDEEWQAAVRDWMETSSVIVMYAGTTKWIGWELERIIEGGWSDKLIILFPPVLPFPGIFQGTWLKRQTADIAARFERLKTTFAGTKWADAWDVEAPETVVCAQLRPDGTVAFTRSQRRSKDAYDLAAKIAHLALLDALPLDTGGRTGDLKPASGA